MRTKTTKKPLPGSPLFPRELWVNRATGEARIISNEHDLDEPWDHIATGTHAEMCVGQAAFKDGYRAGSAQLAAIIKEVVA